MSDHLWNYLQAYAAKHKAAGNGFGFGLVGPDDVSRKLSARYYKDGSEILVKQKSRNPRRLTPRECARLMGFDSPGGKPFTMFQSGYLTLAGSTERRGKTFYRLEHPNWEVRQCFYEALADELVGIESRREQDSDELDRCLREVDFEGLRQRIRSVLASIPHQWYDTSRLADYEAHYAATLLVFFKGLPEVRVTTEDSRSMGRLDIALQAYGQVYLLEFKVQGRSQPGAAIEQMKRRRYMDKYRGLGQPVHLVGLYFSQRTRNVEHFEVETV